MSSAAGKEAASGRVASAGKYLTFGLDEEVYGLAILTVQEIIGLMRVTRVPGLPEVIRGVVNLRGKVIPVLDLRRQFSMAAKADTERTCIVVVRVWHGDRTVTAGLIVDDVREVLAIGEEQIEPLPQISGDAESPFLLGMAKVAQKVMILLDVDQILGSAELWGSTGGAEAQERR